MCLPVGRKEMGGTPLLPGLLDGVASQWGSAGFHNNRRDLCCNLGMFLALPWSRVLIACVAEPLRTLMCLLTAQPLKLFSLASFPSS